MRHKDPFLHSIKVQKDLAGEQSNNNNNNNNNKIATIIKGAYIIQIHILQSHKNDHM
jgi:hypothetical protein